MVRIEGMLDPEAGAAAQAAIELLAKSSAPKTTHPAAAAGGCARHPGGCRGRVRRPAARLQRRPAAPRRDHPLRSAGRSACPHASYDPDAAPTVNGTPVSPDTVRELACDADIIPIVMNGKSEVLDIGRATRIWPKGIRKALQIEDGGCGWPECQMPLWVCRIDHLTYWFHGGVDQQEERRAPLPVPPLAGPSPQVEDLADASPTRSASPDVGEPAPGSRHGHGRPVRRAATAAHEAFEWHLALKPDELPEGRVKTVTIGRRSLAMTHFGEPVRRARQPLPPPGRPARRGVDREGLAALPVARLRLLPLQRQPPPGFTDAPELSRSRSAPTASTSALPDELRTVAHRLRRDGRDDGQLGRHPRLRHGRPLQPRASPTPFAGAEERGELTFIGIRHEGAASFAASAYGKLTGRLAACFAIAGPGSTNLLTGLYDAKVDRAPVLALSGQVPSKVLGRGAFQDVDLDGAFAAVAAYSARPCSADSDHAELINARVQARAHRARRRPPRLPRRGPGPAAPATPRPRRAGRPGRRPARSRRPRPRSDALSR